ncbi:MAG: EAL domain-containing protein [Lachnospiraceae bacterium]|nr:EAL domain-containing protein [Lachnospiraceae bacterium]
MKTTILCTYLLLIAIVGWCIARFFTSKKKDARRLRYPSLIVAVAILSNILLLISTDARLSNLLFGIYYASIDWMLLSFLLFTVFFTGYNVLHPRVYRIFLGVLTADSILLVLNVFHGGLYQMYTVVSADGGLFWRANHSMWFYPHLAICYLMVIACFSTLIRKILNTPRIYWIRYLLILSSFTISVILNIIFMLSMAVADRTIIAYAIVLVLLYFFTNVYQPSVLIDQMLSAVVTGISDGILFFDTDGNCIYANDNIKRLISLTDESLSRWSEKLEPWLHGAPLPGESSNRMLRGEIDGQIYDLEFEFHKLYRSNKLLGAFYRIKDHTEEVRRIEQEKYVATHDALTGLYNSNEFYRRAQEVLDRETESALDMVAVDVREFKLINDVFGSQIGDQVLVELAEHICKAAGESAICGRINNDQFGIFLPRAQFYPQVFESELRKINYLDRNSQYPILVHVGVYEVAERTVPLTVMFSRALIAISQIKKSFREMISYYDDFMRERMLWEQKISGDMENGIAGGEFIIYLQPQVNSQKQPVGAEALVRWNHPTEGFLKPERFIDIFERNGMISKIDTYVWEEACRLLARWKAEGKEHLSVSINISPKDFFYLDIPEVITALVQKYELDPSKLHLEITESIMMTDVERKMKIIKKLHDAGFRVEMDDFGSGYSSLNMLKDLPMDTIKTDMAFLRKSNDPERARSILRLIVSMAGQLKMQVVTEGIANEEQFAFVSEIGSDLFQGNYIGRAVSIEEFEQQWM